VPDVRVPAPTTSGIVPPGADPGSGGEQVAMVGPDPAGGSAHTVTTENIGGGVVVEDVEVRGGSLAATVSAAPDLTSTGTITSASGPTSLVRSAPLSGYATAVFSLSGTPVGATILLETTTDATGATGWTVTEWTQAKNGVLADLSSANGTALPFAAILPIAGQGLVQVRASAFGSGSIGVALRVSALPWSGATMRDMTGRGIETTLTGIAGQLPAALDPGKGSLAVVDDNSAASAGHLATIDTSTVAMLADLATLAATVAASAVKVAIQGTPNVVVTTAPTTAVTAIGGAALAQESGGHLAAVDTSTAALATEGAGAGVHVAVQGTVPTTDAAVETDEGVATGVTSGGALVASLALKTSAGTHLSTTFQLDPTAPTGTYYAQLLAGNAGALPSDGAVTHLHAPIRVVHTSGVLDAPVGWDDTPWGIAIPVGGAFAVLGSTQFTKTISGAYALIDSGVR
jgi:hypothetical protein